MRNWEKQERGVALITVLLIWAVATLVVGSMFGRLDLDRRRTQNLLAGDQAYLYVQGAEEAIIALLLDDLDRDLNNDDDRQGNKDANLTGGDDANKNRRNSDSARVPVDTQDEDWYLLQGYEEFKTFKMPEDGAVVRSELVDLQGRFNLNDLRNDSTGATRRLVALLRDLEIPETGDPVEIASNIRDWLDEDDQPLAYDGEDLYYATLDEPYRTANNYIASVSELNMVKGLSPTDVEKLAPYVTVLPEGTPTNVNTVGIRVLSTFEGIEVVKNVIEGQKDGGFTSVEAAFEGFKRPPPSEWFSVHSEYFLLRVSAELSGSSVVMQSIIYRPAEPTKDNPARVIKRDRARQYRKVVDTTNG